MKKRKQTYRKVKSLKLLYEVDRSGVVRNIKSKRIIAAIPTRNGYLRVHINNKDLFNKCILIHHIVMEAWGPKNPNPELYKTIDHKDRNKLNNHISNLRWATYDEQAQNRDNSFWSQENLNKAVESRKKECVLVRNNKIHNFKSRVECINYLLQVYPDVSELYLRSKLGNSLFKIKGYVFSYLTGPNDYPSMGVDSAKEENTVEKVEPIKGKI